MKNVALQDIAAEALKSHKNRKILAVQDAIRDKIAELEQKEKVVTDAQAKLNRAVRDRDRLRDFLAAVRDGNWEAINIDSNSDTTNQMMAVSDRER